MLKQILQLSACLLIILTLSPVYSYDIQAFENGAKDCASKPKGDTRDKCCDEFGNKFLKQIDGRGYTTSLSSRNKIKSCKEQ